MPDYRSVQELVDERFGVITRPQVNMLTGTVGEAARLVAKNNPSRVAIVIQNTSPSALVAVGFTDEVTLQRGFILNPNGSISFQMPFDFTIPSYEYWAIANAADASIFVAETLTD